jgi:hypothetical protein
MACEGHQAGGANDGEEAGVHGKGGRGAVGHAIFFEHVTHALRLAYWDRAHVSVTVDLHAHDVGEFAQILGFEAIAEGGLELGYPLRVLACQRKVVNIKANHGEYPMTTVDMDLGVGLAVFPTLRDKPVAEELVDLPGGGGLFEAIEAALEVADLDRAICTVYRLFHVDVLFHEGKQKCRVNI